MREARKSFAGALLLVLSLAGTAYASWLGRPLTDVLRCRIRYFSDGAVLGSQAFVATHLARYRQRTGRRRQTQQHLLPSVTDWGDLTTLRGLRRNPIG